MILPLVELPFECARGDMVAVVYPPTDLDGDWLDVVIHRIEDLRVMGYAVITAKGNWAEGSRIIRTGTMPLPIEVVARRVVMKWWRDR